MAAVAEAPVLIVPVSEAAFDASVFQPDMPARSEGTPNAQPDAATPTVAESYSYQTEDGQVRTAENLEQARRLCPVLGAMAADRAERLLKLHARGLEKAAEQSTPVKSDVIKSDNAKEGTLPSRKPVAVKDVPKVAEVTMVEPMRPATPEPIEIIPPPAPPVVRSVVAAKKVPAVPAPAVARAVSPVEMMQPPAIVLPEPVDAVVIHQEIPQMSPAANAPEAKPLEVVQEARPARPVVEDDTEVAGPASSSAPPALTTLRARGAAPRTVTRLLETPEPMPAVPPAHEVMEPTTYEAFTDTLLELAAQPSGEADSLPRPEVSDSPVHEVAERLAVLSGEEKEAATLVVQDITAKLLEASILQQATVPAEKLATIESELTELVTLLFETIGIEYDEAKVRQFVQTLLRPEFIQHLVNEETMALEGVGTHEVKRTFRDLVAALSGLLPQFTTPQVLGMLALNRR